MMIALITVLSLLLGLFVGIFITPIILNRNKSPTKPNKESEISELEKRQQLIKRAEMENFFSYNGSEQKPPEEIALKEINQ